MILILGKTYHRLNARHCSMCLPCITSVCKTMLHETDNHYSFQRREDWHTQMLHDLPEATLLEAGQAGLGGWQYVSRVSSLNCVTSLTVGPCHGKLYVST